jgi:FkbM family methyltransferase
MLVLCVGMYRACSTWQYGVVGELIERHQGGRRLGFADGAGFVSTVEPTLEHSRWSVLKAHDAHERFAQRLTRGQALGIYSHRDLRDVAFSWMHKTGLTFDELIERGFLEHCLHNDRFWRDQPGMLLQAYEDLVADPARGVAEIAHHLGIGLDEGEDRAIADLLSFEANKKRTTDLTERLQAEGVALTSKDQDKYDRDTLLHWNHIRDGRSGTWRELASPEQQATLARICGPWLVEHGYEVDPDRPAAPPRRKAEPPRETRARVTYAQNREDVLLDRLFRGKKGTYIDVGANHPTFNNSTYYFYIRGWRGVNVEPVRSAFELFAERRPGDLNLQVAVSDSEGTMPFYEVADCNGLSSLDPDTVEVQAAKGFHVVERSVSVRTIATLIEEHELVPPDIFSIDVEGSEENVLRGIPLASWRPKVFVIEATQPMTNIPCHQSWEPILLEQGYLFAAFDGINRFYLRGDMADLLPLFEYPVNALDFYVPAETVEQRERADFFQAQAAENRRQAEEIHAWLVEAKVELAELKIRFGNELDDRHRHYLAWLDEREGWEGERRNWQAEREAWQAERQSLQSGLEETRADLHALARRVEELEKIREEQALEIDSLHGVIGRLQGQVRDRDVELDLTRTKLGPYLKIDRLGMVTALQKKVHAHRAHAKG